MNFKILIEQFLIDNLKLNAYKNGPESDGAIFIGKLLSAFLAMEDDSARLDYALDVLGTTREGIDAKIAKAKKGGAS
jgi:hypothetical protein